MCSGQQRKSYAFGNDFLTSAQHAGYFASDGLSLNKHLAETCARIILAQPKSDLNTFQTKTINDNWKSLRTHLTERGRAYRLMLWQTPNGSVVFANIGVKAELAISEDVPANPEYQ